MSRLRPAHYRPARARADRDRTMPDRANLDDHVRFGGLGRIVRDMQHGVITQTPADRVEHGRRAGRIQVCGRLVEQHQPAGPRVQQGTGQRQPGPLAAGDGRAGRTEPDVQPIGPAGSAALLSAARSASSSASGSAMRRFSRTVVDTSCGSCGHQVTVAGTLSGRVRAGRKPEQQRQQRRLAGPGRARPPRPALPAGMSQADVAQRQLPRLRGQRTSTPADESEPSELTTAGATGSAGPRRAPRRCARARPAARQGVARPGRARPRFPPMPTEPAPAPARATGASRPAATSVPGQPQRDQARETERRQRDRAWPRPAPKACRRARAASVESNAASSARRSRCAPLASSSPAPSSNASTAVLDSRRPSRQRGGRRAEPPTRQQPIHQSRGKQGNGQHNRGRRQTATRT